MKPEDIAFQDFTNSVSIDVFEAVLAVAKKEYSIIEKILSVREKFLDESVDLMSNQEGQEEIPQELRDKLHAGFERRTAKDIREDWSAELKRINHITEFINTFSKEEDQVEQLIINF